MFSPFKNINNNYIQINNINTPQNVINNYNLNTQVFPKIDYCVDNYINSINTNRQNNINNNSFNLNRHEFDNNTNFSENIPISDDSFDFSYINIFHGGATNREITIIKNRLNKTKIKKVLELDGSKKNCIICFEDFKENQNIYILPCSHIFHVRCFNKEVKLRQKCPICRKSL